MHNLSQTISEYIEQQFPDVYREDGPNLVAFVKAYYEFLENTSTSPTTLSRSMFSNRDIDETLDSFLVHFKEKFLSEFPYAQAVDNRFAIKHIMDYYRSKGTPQAAELLIRFLFNEEAKVYYPGDDILRPSHSKWKIPQYIEVTQTTRAIGFIGKQIRGSRSGASAFVEGLVKKRVQGRIIDILYLSEIKGTFVTGELVRDDGIDAGAPRITGSLSSMVVTNGGAGNAIGDIYNVIDDTGRQGKVRVTGTTSSTGRVEFTLVDGGTGYTLNDLDDGDPLDDYTDVYTATAMINVDNSNTLNQFIQFETVKQEREIVSLFSATDVANAYFDAFNANTELVIDDYAVGVKTWVESYTANTTNGPEFLRPADTEGNDLLVLADDVLVSNADYSTNSTHIIFDTDPTEGTVVKVIEYTVVANGKVALVSDEAPNTDVTVVITTGTFANQISIDTSNTATFATNEIIVEQSTVELTVPDANTFSTHIGEKLEMKVYTSGTANGEYLSSYAYGYLIDANVSSNTLILEPSWGTFTVNETVDLFFANGTSQASETIDAVNISSAGATGVISSSTDANTWNIEVTSGAFNAPNKVLGLTSRVEEQITAVRETGATDLWYNGDPTANGVIDSVANNTVTGIVIGQNTSYVGLHGNTSAFSFIEGAGMTIKTSREDIKLHDLVDQPNLELEIITIGTGSGATFQPGSLENEETVSLNTDFVGANNVGNQNFLDIVVGTASNSAFGFVDSITINNGGTLYSNGTFNVTFNGGGFGDGDPLVKAIGSITTNGSGVITDITVDYGGEGYWATPTIILPSTSGTTADVTVNMDFGYGFIKNPSGDSTTAFADLFTFDDFTMGTISSLTRINPGQDYNTDPFTSVYNRYVAAYDRKDITLNVNLISGNFAPGEIVEQDSVEKGVVISANSSVINVKRTKFNTSWSGSNVIGATSGAIAGFTVGDDAVDLASRAMGDNAVITGEVVVSDGVATTVEVIDSGYGYLGNQSMTLTAANSAFVITANSVVATQGIGTGYWESKEAHISDTAKIRDNRYYQEYSYDIQTGVSLNRYRDIVRKVLHVSGTELFGTVIKNSVINNNISAATSTTDTVSTS